jgi:hypothetical protein
MPDDDGQGSLFDDFDDDDDDDDGEDAGAPPEEPGCPTCPHPEHTGWCSTTGCGCFRHAAASYAAWEPREHTPSDGTETQDDAAEAQRNEADIRINQLFDRYLDYLLSDPALFWHRVEHGALEWEFLEWTDSPFDDGWRQRVGDIRNKRGWMEWHPLPAHLQTNPDKIRYRTRRYQDNSRMTGNISYLTDDGKAELYRRRPDHPLLRQLVRNLTASAR